MPVWRTTGLMKVGFHGISQVFGVIRDGALEELASVSDREADFMRH
jgi:hypothetical protein